VKCGAEETKGKAKPKKCFMIEDVSGCSGGITGDNQLIHDRNLAGSCESAGEQFEYANPPCFGPR
jgi:hypothetical protein